VSETFHIIGDVHGCRTQLEALLEKLGYARPAPGGDPYDWTAPPGSVAVFLGDLVDRGPDSLGCLWILERLLAKGQARWVLGNHELKCRQLVRHLLGKEKESGPISAGTLTTWTQLLGLSADRLSRVRGLIDRAPGYLELVPGELIVVHARWEERFATLPRLAQWMACAAGESDQDDRKIPDDAEVEVDHGRGMLDLEPFAPLAPRARWIRRWHGPALVAWGHQVVRPGRVVRVGRSIAVDSGCCQGYALSAYVWPSHDVVQVEGEPSWKARMASYAKAGVLLFPKTRAAAYDRLARMKPIDPDDYAWRIGIELERRGLPRPWPELEAAHRGIFAQWRRASTGT